MNETEIVETEKPSEILNNDNNKASDNEIEEWDVLAVVAGKS